MSETVKLRDVQWGKETGFQERILQDLTSSTSTAVESLNEIVVPTMLIFYHDDKVYYPDYPSFKASFSIVNGGETLKSYRIYYNKSAENHYRMTPTGGLIFPGEEIRINMRTKKNVLELNRTVMAKDIVSIRSIDVDENDENVKDPNHLDRMWRMIMLGNPKSVKSAEITGESMHILDYTCLHLLRSLCMSPEEKLQIQKSLERQHFDNITYKRPRKMYKVIPGILSEIRRKQKQAAAHKKNRKFFIITFFAVFFFMHFFVAPSILHEPLPEVKPATSNWLWDMIKFYCDVFLGTNFMDVNNE